MALKFRYNDTTYSLATSDKGSVNFCYQQNGTTYKVPASSTRGTSVQFAEDDNYYYKMDNSSPTLCFRKNDTTYYCAKSITSEAKVTYDIPAGTYTPSAFETLVKNYISLAGNRTTANAFTVTVNKQTVSVASNTKIYYGATGTSSGTPVTYGVGFNKSPDFSSDAAASNGFTKYKTYIVSANSTLLPYFNNYANYNITVTTGIKFS